VKGAKCDAISAFALHVTTFYTLVHTALLSHPLTFSRPLYLIRHIIGSVCMGKVSGMGIIIHIICYFHHYTITELSRMIQILCKQGWIATFQMNATSGIGGRQAILSNIVLNSRKFMMRPFLTGQPSNSYSSCSSSLSNLKKNQCHT